VHNKISGGQGHFGWCTGIGITVFKRLWNLPGIFKNLCVKGALADILTS